MSKLEDGPAANAFLELHAAASAISTEHANSQPHMNRIFAAPMKEQHLAMRSLKDTMHARSCALGHKAQAEAAVKAARARLASLRSSGKPEAVLQVRACVVVVVVVAPSSFCGAVLGNDNLWGNPETVSVRTRSQIR